MTDEDIKHFVAENEELRRVLQQFQATHRDRMAVERENFIVRLVDENKRLHARLEPLADRVTELEKRTSNFNVETSEAHAMYHWVTKQIDSINRKIRALKPQLVKAKEDRVIVQKPVRPMIRPVPGFID